LKSVSFLVVFNLVKPSKNVDMKKYICLLLLALLGGKMALAQDLGKLYMGHCDLYAPGNPGVGKQVGYYASTVGSDYVTAMASFSPSSLKPYVGYKVIGVRVGVAGDILDAWGVLHDGPLGKEIYQEKTSLFKGWNDIMFKKPYVIEAQKHIAFGYKYQPNTLPDVSAMVIDSDANFNAPAEACYLLRSSGRANSFTRDLGALRIFLIIEAPVAKYGNLGSLSNLTVKPSLDKDNNVVVEYHVENRGISPIDKFEVVYNVNGSNVGTQEYTFSEFTAPSFRKVRSQGIPAKNGDKLVIMVRKVNGERPSSAPKLEGVVQGTAPNYFERKVLLEHFTTEQCSSCPGAHKHMASVLEKPEYQGRVVWVAHHVGYKTDKFTLEDSKKMFFLFDEENGVAAPSMVVDRMPSNFIKDYPHPAHPILPTSQPDLFENCIIEGLDRPASASVNIAEQYTPATRTIDVEVSGEIRGNIGTDDVYLSLWLVEDNIYTRDQKGTGSAPEGGPNPTYQHNVIRKFVTKIDGEKMTITDGKYSYKTQVVLPDTQVGFNSRLVAFVGQNLAPTNPLKAQVYNANETRIKAFESAEMPQETAAPVVYAQDGRLVASDASAVIDKVYTVGGALVANENLVPGMYVAVVVTASGTYTVKVVL
jgi:hypothetical protein